MALSLKACRGLVYNYMLVEGWLPSGTTNTTWPSVTMDDLMFDDPPLPSDPDFQKRRAALDLRAQFHALGAVLSDPFKKLNETALTLGEFAAWCHANHT